MSKEKKYYAVEDKEVSFEELEDAIEDYIESNPDFSYPITVYVGKRMKISLTGKDIIEDILEELDEEHSDPDGDYTKPTKEMLNAANALADIINKQYKSYWIEPTGEKITIEGE